MSRRTGPVNGWPPGASAHKARATREEEAARAAEAEAGRAAEAARREAEELWNKVFYRPELWPC
jgi:hypothetical protein